MLFSFIVPVYQIKEYVAACIESILSQTYEDFEVILVDDGSTDGSGEICDSYGERDPRITVIHKANGGLVSARQAGIRRAKGEYIINVDGDDWISPYLAACSAEIIGKYAADMICYGYYQISEGTEAACTEPAEEGFYEKKDMAEAIYPKLLLDGQMNHMFYFLWGKVIRKSLLYGPQMAVDQRIAYGEDIVCLTPVYMDAANCYISRQLMYYYRRHGQAMSVDFKMERYRQVELCIQSLSRNHSPDIPDYEEQLNRYTLFECFVLLVFVTRVKGFRYLREIRGYMEGETFRERNRKAKFGRVSKKTAVTYGLLRKNHIRSAYFFLRFCNIVKGFLR